MRITANREEKYPLLGALIESIADDIRRDPEFERTLFESCGDRREELERALALGSNPWVTVEVVDGGDPRGRYATSRRNTIVLGEDLADRLIAGGHGDAETYREVVLVLSRGLLHWLAGKDWKSAASAPGAAFEKLVMERGTGRVDPERQEERGPTEEGPRDMPADSASEAIAQRLGARILDIAKRHLGQKYAFSPTPNYDDPDWKGPFDCAEYISYCAFRAYGIPYGVVADPANRYNSYSGYWQRDAEKFGIRISWRDALHIPGAIVLRYPPGNDPPPYGHLAISLGNGGDTYEARGAQWGVTKHTAIGRSWNTGVLLPGVLYDVPDGDGSDLLIFKVLDPLAGYSPIVEEIQKKLVGLGLMAEVQVNGLYDAVTSKAVSMFQDRKGVTVDGEVGPSTGALLGLGDIWQKAPVVDRPGLADDLPKTDASVDAEILTLARTLYGEARGEPKAGIEAVANVILNRVRSERYPKTVAKVCLQRLQFSCWNDSDPNRRVIRDLRPGANAIFDMIFAIATQAVLGGLPLLVAGALHYHARGINPAWVRNSPGATLVATIGNHLFWSGIR